MHLNDQYIRVDKNFAFNIKEFRGFNEDAKIIKALLMYMAYDNQKDLFGFYKLDPEHFAKVMFLNKQDLFRIHPDPIQLQNVEASKLIENERKHGRMSEYRTWSSYLENALYILHTKTIIKEYRYKLDDKAIGTTKKFEFLKEIEFQLETTGKTKKIVYRYIPDERFEDNLKGYFLNTKIEKYNMLRKPKLEDAYLELLNRINLANLKKRNALDFDIDYFANILAVGSYSRFSDYKRKITQKFKTLRDVIADDVPGLKLVWGRNYGHVEALENTLTISKKKKPVRYNNKPIVVWDRLSEEEERGKIAKSFKNIFDTELIKSLVKICFNHYENDVTKLSDEGKKIFFYRWFFSEKDLDVKAIKYQDSYVSIYKSTKGLPGHVHNFKKLLKYIIEVQTKYRVINYVGEDIVLHLKDKKLTFNYLYELLDYFRENHVN